MPWNYTYFYDTLSFVFSGSGSRLNKFTNYSKFVSSFCSAKSIWESIGLVYEWLWISVLRLVGIDFSTYESKAFLPCENLATQIVCALRILLLGGWLHYTFGNFSTNYIYNEYHKWYKIICRLKNIWESFVLACRFLL